MMHLSEFLNQVWYQFLENEEMNKKRNLSKHTEKKRAFLDIFPLWFDCMEAPKDCEWGSLSTWNGCAHPISWECVWAVCPGVANDTSLYQAEVLVALGQQRSEESEARVSENPKPQQQWGRGRCPTKSRAPEYSKSERDKARLQAHANQGSQSWNPLSRRGQGMRPLFISFPPPNPESCTFHTSVFSLFSVIMQNLPLFKIRVTSLLFHKALPAGSQPQRFFLSLTYTANHLCISFRAKSYVVFWYLQNCFNASCFPTPDDKFLKVRTWSIVKEVRPGKPFPEGRLAYPLKEPLAWGLLGFPEYWGAGGGSSVRAESSRVSGPSTASMG